MNKYQWITTAVAAANILLVVLFPPFDYISPAARVNVPTFEGFSFVFTVPPGRFVNSSFLQLEIFVILINAAIAWLLLRDRPQQAAEKKIDWQRLVLFGVGLNLLLVLLFPPMQPYYAVTHSALPSFDGFYFIFGDYGKRTLVTEILYLEVVFILFNGGLLYLLFRETKPVELSAEARLAMAEELRRMSQR